MKVKVWRQVEEDMTLDDYRQLCNYPAVDDWPEPKYAIGAVVRIKPLDANYKGIYSNVHTSLPWNELAIVYGVNYNQKTKRYSYDCAWYNNVDDSRHIMTGLTEEFMEFV